MKSAFGAGKVYPSYKQSFHILPLLSKDEGELADTVGMDEGQMLPTLVLVGLPLGHQNLCGWLDVGRMIIGYSG